MHKANKRCLKFLLLAHLRWPWTLSFSLSSLSLASLHSDSAESLRFWRGASVSPARTQHLPHSPVYVFYKFSSSKNNERARHVLSGKSYVALLQRARWCTHECAHLRFYCTIKTTSGQATIIIVMWLHSHTRKRRFGKIWKRKEMPQGWTDDKELSRPVIFN